MRRQTDAESLHAEHDRITPVTLDVTDAAQIDAAARFVSEQVGDSGLNALVNNAGIGFGGPIEYLPMHYWQQQFAVNVFGQVAVTRAMLPLLRRANPPGRIIMMSSISGRVASPMLGPYSSSKFALEAISDALRVELRPWNLHVAVIEPGSIETPIWRKGRAMIDQLEKELPDEAFERYSDVMNGLVASADRSERHAAPTAAVVRAVQRALTARRPKTRYLVGRDARLGALFAGLLPDRWRDALIARGLRQRTGAARQS